MYLTVESTLGYRVRSRLRLVTVTYSILRVQDPVTHLAISFDRFYQLAQIISIFEKGQPPVPLSEMSPSLSQMYWLFPLPVFRARINQAERGNNWDVSVIKSRARLDLFHLLEPPDARRVRVFNIDRPKRRKVRLWVTWPGFDRHHIHFTDPVPGSVLSVAFSLTCDWCESFLFNYVAFRTTYG